MMAIRNNFKKQRSPERKKTVFEVFDCHEKHEDYDDCDSCKSHEHFLEKEKEERQKKIEALMKEILNDQVYMNMPKKVKDAMDEATKMRIFGDFYESDFYLKLIRLNRKIKVFKQAFYTKKPIHEYHWQKRKTKALDDMKIKEQ